MNKARRKALSSAVRVLEDVATNLEELRDEEQDSYDNIPEGLQQSERGDSMQACIEHIEDAIDNINEAINNLEETL